MRTRALRLIAAAAAVLAVGGLAGCAADASAQPDASPTASAHVTLADRLARADADDPLAIGAVDAPLTIVEWMDFSCPYCAMFTVDTMPTLIEEYVDSGLVRYEFHDVAKLGEESMEAAIAARAAGEQGRYVEYVEALSAASPRDGHPVFTEESLVGFAEAAGVEDIDGFRSRLGADDLRAAVEESQAAAYAAGIESIPSFVVGDEYLLGAVSVDEFRAVVDAQLDAAGA